MVKPVLSKLVGHIEFRVYPRAHYQKKIVTSDTKKASEIDFMILNCFMGFQMLNNSRVVIGEGSFSKFWSS